VPIFLLWGVLLPYILYRKIKKDSDSKEYYEVLAKYPFYVAGYSKDYTYWEFVIMARKISLIAIVMFFN